MAITYDWAITNTEFSALRDGTPYRVLKLFWSCSATESGASVATSGEEPVDLDYNTITEEQALSIVQSANPTTEDDLAILLLGKLAPGLGKGLPWGTTYRVWTAGVAYAIGDKVTYNVTNYECVQAHTAERNWTPPKVPALWKLVIDSNNPQPWVQPTGAQDAYDIGDQVTHDNPNDGGTIWVYESAIAANATEPGRDGTFDRWWTPIRAA